jgi:cysteine desulfurase/selenocysteine lyase
MNPESILQRQKKVFSTVGRIPLSACSVSTTHPAATRAMLKYLEFRGPRGIESFKSPMVSKAAQGLRLAGGKLLSTDSSNISIVQNCHDALQMVAFSMREELPTSAKILLYEHEYPSNFIVWTRPRSKFGFKEVIIRGETLEGKPLKFSIDEVEAKISSDRDIKIFAVSQVQFQSGFALSHEVLERLGRLCKQHGVVFVVDAAQSLGSTAIYPEKIFAHVLVSSGWKWQSGPEGIGLMYTSPEFRAAYPLGPYGGDNRAESSYAQREFTPLSDGRRFEPSTISRTNIIGMTEALNRLAVPLGGEVIEREIRRLQGRFLDQVDTNKFRLVPLSQEERIGILSFNLPKGINPQRMKSWLWNWRRKIIVPSPQGGYFRVAIHAYNTDAQVDTAARAINQYLESRR